MHTRTVPFTLRRAARWYPHTEAFIAGDDPDRRYTYAAADEWAGRIAAALAALGVGHGDRVALLSSSTPEHALVHYGATRLGAVPAGLHYREAPDTLAEMVNRIRARVLVVHPRFADTLARFRDQLTHTEAIVALDTLGDVPPGTLALSELTAGVEPLDPVAVVPDDVAFLNFTSGSTGHPKALVTRHGQISRMLLLEAGAKTEHSRILNAFAPGFMGWENVTLTNVHAAATTVFTDDIEQVPGLIERERLSRVSLVTTPWRILVQSGALDSCDTSSVESAGISGEPVNPTLYRRIQELVTENVGTGYGLTETMGSGTSLPAHQIDERTIASVGKPAAGCDVRIVEPDTRDPGATLPDGEVGEVVITGPSVCEEVWERPEVTAETFVDGWVFTGDRGRVEEGFLFLQGREDGMIISGGVNVYPERVETALEEHPAVVACGVVGVPDETWGERVTAYVVADGDPIADLDTWCRENDALADHQRPREYVFVERLPRSNTDKFDRAALRQRAREELGD